MSAPSLADVEQGIAAALASGDSFGGIAVALDRTAGTGDPIPSPEDLNVDQVATMFASAEAACDALLFFQGTHAAGSSLSDQVLACQAAARGGRTARAAIEAAAAAAFPISGLVYWYLLREGERPSPAPGAGTAEDSIAPRRVPLPPAVSTQVEDVAGALLSRNPAQLETLDNARVVARQCLWSMARLAVNGRRTCRALPIFASGNDVPEATIHDLEAITGTPVWARLNYEAASTKSGDRTWYRTDVRCNDQGPFQQCDEYPFWSSEQGGGLAVPVPSLKLIASSDNASQGGKYGYFVRSCSLQSRPTVAVGDAFLSIPLDPAGPVSTLGLCNSSAG